MKTPDINSNSNGRLTVDDVLAQRFIAEIENGTAPWQKRWANFLAANGERPAKAYSGINAFILGLWGEDTFFFTAKQIIRLGGTVPKGEGLPIVFFKTVSTVEVENGEAVQRTKFIARYYLVFPAAKCNIPAAKWKRPSLTRLDFKPSEAAEALLALNTCPISHYGDSAFYSPAFHNIVLPVRSSFKTEGAYYSTAFHEIGHSLKDSPHEGGFGSNPYGREELVAEFFAALCLNHCGMLSDDCFSNSASYLSSWLKTIKEDPSIVRKAANEAARRFKRFLGEDKAEGEEEGAE